MIDLVQVLRDEGLTVIDRRITPRLPFEPIGVMLHHTASNAEAGNFASLQYIIDRKLSNIVIGRNCEVVVVTEGVAAHAGQGHPSVLARTRTGLPPVTVDKPLVAVSGNPWYIGIEIENDGVREPWAPELIDTSCRTAAAICRSMGWLSDRVVLHREWAPWRKIDPNWGDGPEWRRSVAAILHAVEGSSVGDTIPAQEDDMSLRLRFIKREVQPDGSNDPRVYVTDGMSKRRILTMERLTALAEDIGMPVVIESWDATTVNDLPTVGEDPS